MKKKVALQSLSLPWYLAYRRLFPQSYVPGVTLLPRLAFFSIVLGVAASILILSLSNGLHHSYLSRLAETDSHLTAVSAGRGIPNYQEMIFQIQNHPQVLFAYPYAQKEALLKSYSETTGVVLKAYPPSFSKDLIFNRYFHLLKGKWSFDQPRTITIGKSLAQNLALSVGNYIDILTYDDDFGAITYRFQISGVFTANDAFMDKGLAFINFDDAAEVFNFSRYTPSIGIRIKDAQNPSPVAYSLEKNLPLTITTWKLSHLNTLLALQNEKQIIRVLLLIFFSVTFFGILSVMTALVADKREEIALLKALGITPQSNIRSFIYTGLLLGVSATLLGSFIGILVSLFFNNIINGIEYIINIIFQIIALILGQNPPKAFYFLNQSVYYLKDFPIRIQGEDILFSAISALLCTLLAAIYPAHLSKSFSPADILRKRAF